MKQPLKDTQFNFKRYEVKYLLTEEKYNRFMERAEEHLVPDEYHLSNILSIYYDTDDFRLLRESIEKPVYKEKLRVRSYGIPDEESNVFVELKKKYKGVVYKRRVQMKAGEASQWLSGESSAPYENQITREIDWFLKQNPVVPRAFIGSSRISWADRENPELRITFDEQITWRDKNLSLTAGDEGEQLLENGMRLMEIKIPGAAPMWLAAILSEEGIFPTGFSKYGSCYKKELINQREWKYVE